MIPAAWAASREDDSERTRGIRSSIAAGPKSRNADSSETPPASGVPRNGPSSSNPESNGAPSSSTYRLEMLPRAVDSFSDRLRQYVAVPADVSPVSASSLAVDIRTFPWIRRLASDYAFAFANVSPFFAGDPATPAAWADTIARSQGYSRQPAEIAQIIAAQQAERGAPAQARESAALLADPATRVVITGQQAGLFGGPLFTLLKAITTMKLAAQVEREHRVPVVPVFWIDA